MSAIQGLWKQAELNAAIDKQLEKITEGVRGIQGGLANIDVGVLKQYLDEVGRLYLAVQTEIIFKKESNVNCCFRTKSPLSRWGSGESGKKCRKISLVMIPGTALVAGFLCLGINNALTSSCQSQSSKVPIGVVYTAMMVMTITLIFLWSRLKKSTVADQASEAIIHSHFQDWEEQKLLLVFLKTLRNFDERRDTEALRQCLQALHFVPPRYLEKLPSSDQFVSALAYLMPDRHQCKQLMDKLFSLVVEKFMDENQLRVSEGLGLKRALPDEISLVLSARVDEETKERVDGSARADDPLIKEEESNAPTKEYQEKWANLEGLLGVSVDTLEFEGVCYNKNGKCWLKEPSKDVEKKVAVIPETEEDLSKEENSLDASQLTTRSPLEFSARAPTPFYSSELALRVSTPFPSTSATPNPSPRHPHEVVPVARNDDDIPLTTSAFLTVPPVAGIRLVVSSVAEGAEV